MHIDDDLTDCLRPDVCKEDIEATYSIESRFDYVSDADTAVDRDYLPFLDRPRYADNSLPITYKVRIHEHDKILCVFCIRQYFSSKRLYSRGTSGPAILRFKLEVREQRRRGGLAGTIVDQEDSILFRKLNIAEVQVWVTGKGFVTWTRSRFNYEIIGSDMAVLEGEYRREFKDQGRLIESLRDFPQEFWKYLHGTDIQVIFFKPLRHES